MCLNRSRTHSVSDTERSFRPTAPVSTSNQIGLTGPIELEMAVDEFPVALHVELQVLKEAAKQSKLQNVAEIRLLAQSSCRVNLVQLSDLEVVSPKLAKSFSAGITPGASPRKSVAVL